jgi:putative selenate reductase
MCNECGNCAIFCPHTGKPYREKFTVFLNQEDFKDSENPGFLRTGSGSCKIRLEDKSVVDFSSGGKNIPANWAAMIDTIETKYGYLIQNK